MRKSNVCFRPVADNRKPASLSPMKLVRTILIVTLATLPSVPVQATSTVCSNPRRERVLASAVVRLPTDNIQALERSFDIAGRGIGMSPWGTSLLDRHGRVERQTLGLQSPRVSVSVRAKWRPGQRAADVEIWRTCINDASEPWRGYWWGLVNALESAGYTVMPASARKVS